MPKKHKPSSVAWWKFGLDLLPVLLLTIFLPVRIPGLEALSDQAKSNKPQPSPKGSAEACSREPYRRNPALGAQGNYDAGLCLLKHERLREAADAFQAALQLNPKFEAAHEALGVVFLRAGKAENAKEEFISALELNPKSVEARLNLGSALIQEKNFTEALWEVLKALRLSPKSVQRLGR